MDCHLRVADSLFVRATAGFVCVHPQSLSVRSLDHDDVRGAAEDGTDYYILRGETMTGETISLPPVEVTNALAGRAWGFVSATVENKSFSIRIRILPILNYFPRPVELRTCRRRHVCRNYSVPGVRSTTRVYPDFLGPVKSRAAGCVSLGRRQLRQLRPLCSNMASGTLKRFVPTSAAALGSIRAALFGFVLVDVLATGFVDLGRLPITLMRPTGLMQLFSWGFYEIVLTPRGMLVLKIALVVSLAAASAGLLTSASTKSAALLFLFYQGLVRSFGHFNHDEMPVVYMLIALAFTPCGDAWSIDSLFHRTRTRVGDVVYGFPILLLRGLLAWSYFSSALIKLRVTGLEYFNSDNLPTVAILHSLDNLHNTQHRLAFWLTSAVEFTAVSHS